jgi:hypothetical protein
VSPPRSRRFLILALGVACAGYCVAAGAAGSAAQSSACSPAGARTVIANSEVRVLRYSKEDPSFAGATVSCALKTGNVIELDDPVEGDLVFSRPAIALAGHMVAYGANVNTDDGLSTYVRVVDATQSISSLREMETELKVGSVVVRESGSVAWISCRVDFDDTPPASRGPECVRPGSLDRVYTAKPQGRPHVIARGRDIDPDSLRLHGTRLSWRARGRTRTASLR